jgi:hypothetical protein
MDDDLADVLAQLAAREPLFHRTELGTDRATFEVMTAEDFWEVGASGAVYDREVVWAALEQRYAAGQPDEWEIDDVSVRRLGEHVYLVTYLLRQGSRTSRRATIWEDAGGSWRIVYHQGTIVPG